ncbi:MULTISPECIES: hypothetical protein [Giesbergeria]|uniref:Scaffolding protein n=1 Tax=Giesbergeria sinuosa TaxID=80883 RepID=A0ABV9QAX3_9BURK
MSTTPPDAFALSEQDKALLTPEELAAIHDGDVSEDEKAAMAKLAAMAPAEDGDDTPPAPSGDEDLGTTDPAPAPDTTAEPPATAMPASAPAAEVVEVAKAPAPVYQVVLPDDFEQRQQDVNGKLADLRQKFRTGEIEVDQYEVERDALSAQLNELTSLQTKAEIAREMQQQARHQEINTSLTAVMAQAKADGIDYNDPKQAAMFDRYANFLAGDPDFAGKSVAQIHAEAHKNVLQRLGKAAATPAPAPAAPPAAAPTPRKTPLETAPKTLAQVPGADDANTDLNGGEFTQLDSLDGLELEDALARMPKAQREQYLRGGR